MPLENDSKPETIQFLSTEVEKSYGNGHGSFPTRNFSTKENERHSPHPWSKHDAAPVWSDKGLISYERLLQLRQYRTPINSPAINSLHWALFLSICSCLTSIRAPFSCLQVVVSIWRWLSGLKWRSVARSAIGQAVLTLWSWAAQLHTSSFHCDIIFDIQFETLNSFNAISQHNDSNKAVPLAFDLTTKGKSGEGETTASIMLTPLLLAQ